MSALPCRGIRRAHELAAEARYATRMFGLRCHENGIEHRLTKPNHPLDERPGRTDEPTLKDATVKRYHYETHGQLREHLSAFVAAYNFAKRLKTLSAGSN